MGSLCSCCSRKAATITTSETQAMLNGETQAMLNASIDDHDAKILKEEETEQKESSPKTAGYGSTDHVSYTSLKDKSGTTKILNAKHETTKKKHKNNDNKVKLNDDEIKGEEKEDHHIPISQTNLIIANAGYNEINGDYRWFVHSSKWCLFREDVQYSMENGVSVDDVYKQLIKLQAANSNFRWNDNIKKCWIISCIDGSVIYYAAPQSTENEEFIPNNKDIWISVHGSLPPPDIYPNLIESSLPPDKNEQFGNVTPKNKDSLHRKSSSSLTTITESTQKVNDDNLDEKQPDIVADDDQNDEDEEESLSDLD